MIPSRYKSVIRRMLLFVGQGLSKLFISFETSHRFGLAFMIFSSVGKEMSDVIFFSCMLRCFSMSSAIG